MTIVLPPKALPVILAAGERCEESDPAAVLFGVQTLSPLSLCQEVSHSC